MVGHQGGGFLRLQEPLREIDDMQTETEAEATASQAAAWGASRINWLLYYSISAQADGRGRQ
jgi:hypothetical protein